MRGSEQKSEAESRRSLDDDLCCLDLHNEPAQAYSGLVKATLVKMVELRAFTTVAIKPLFSARRLIPAPT